MGGITSRAWRTAIGRGALYAFLARALAYPDAAHRSALDETILPVLRGVRPADEALARALADALRAAEGPLDELRRAHVTLFPPLGSPECAVYETAYRTRDLFQETEILADLAGFYRAHGLTVGGLERERPDHIAVELEFVGFMARKEAHALAALGRSEVAECRRTQAAFLRDHLGGWGPTFGVRVGAAATHPFYRAIGELLRRWLASDMSAQHIDAPAPFGDPLPPAPGETEGSDAAACPLEGVLS